MSLVRRRRDEQEDQKTFWLEFQVCHDGLTPPPPPPSSSSSSSSSTSTTPTSFPLFPFLPYELRHKIWAHLLQPRIVIAACLTTDDAPRKRAQLARRPRLPPTPPLLHVCRETRALALARYGDAGPRLAWRVPRHIFAQAPPPVSSSSSSSSCSLPSPPGDQGRRETATATSPSSPGPGAWFDFDRDALLLLGELEPFDACGVNAPMAYFLDKGDARRVRHVACAFEELRLGEVEGEHVFGSLFHVVDGFPAAGRLVITSTDEDLAREAEARGGRPLDLGLGRTENVVQKIWWGWVNGTSLVTSQLRDKQILMVREDALADFVAEQT